MIPLLLMVSLLPLDLSTAPVVSADAEVALSARLEGRFVIARLTNVSGKPLRLEVGMSCSGPEELEAIVDGVARPFLTVPRPCDKNVPKVREIPVGRFVDIPSEWVVLDSAAHQVAVRWKSPRHALTSPAVAAGAATLELRLHIRGPHVAGKMIPVEVEHRWLGSTRMRFLAGWKGVCTGPTASVIVDGLPTYIGSDQVCDGPVLEDLRELAPGESFVVQGALRLTPGRHLLWAQFKVPAKNGKVSDGIPTWSGVASSGTMAVSAASP